MAEIISVRFVSRFVEYSWRDIMVESTRHMRYIIIWQKNVEKFNEKMQALMKKKENVQQEVEAAERKAEEIKPDVVLWQKTVDKVIDEKEKQMKDLEENAKKKCFIGLCPNIKCRYQLSRKAEEGAVAVDELLQQGAFDSVGYRDVLEVPETLKAYRDFDSRKKIFDGVVDALKDSATSIIGVYGTGGVGKTTLVNEVARRVKVNNSFGWVAEATVTQTPNIEKIQDELAESLRLELKAKSIPERARLLLARLKQEEEEKRILIVLNDIWARLDLEQVGIPFGNQHEGCKILLTSRNRHVLTDEMDAEKTFAIDVLNAAEAWELFKEMAENDFEDPMLQPVAKKVAKKCEGLPIAIETIARALRNKDIDAWKYAYVQVHRPSPSYFTGIPAIVYSTIKFSYDSLQSEELKQTFLLCGLLGHNARVEDLVRYGLGLRLYENVNTVQHLRYRVMTLVRKLKNSCLLHDSYNNELFNMHDLVRDVALAIASRGNHAFVLKHEGVFEDWPDEERMRRFKMIRLSFDSVEEFPHELEFPKLEFFSMGIKDYCVEMPVKFFEKMKNIKVLDLIKMNLSSISLPTSLRTLVLNQCVLEDMVSLGRLKNLELLSLSGSNMEMLPVEIGKLTKLISLDLSGCAELRIIPIGVLSSLSKLEELYMGSSFLRWNQPSNAGLAELKNLSCLTTLEVHVLDAAIVPNDLFFAKLQRYKILIGDAWDWVDKTEYSRTLKLKVNTSINHLDNGLKLLLKKTEALSLEDLGVKLVLNEVGHGEGFLQLKYLHIRDALKIQHIMNANDVIEEMHDVIEEMQDEIAFPQLRSLALEKLPQLISFCARNISGDSTSTPQQELALFDERATFPWLEELRLSKLPKLTQLLEEGVQPGFIFPNLSALELQDCSRLKNLGSASVSFENLMVLEVSKCHGFDHLLKPSTARSLTQLQRISIADCRMIKEVIGDLGGTATISIRFPSLRFLRLTSLPNLTSFCSGNYDFEFPSLEKLIVKECPQLKVFSQGHLSTPLLSSIRTAKVGDRRWAGDVNTTIRGMYTEAKSQNPDKEWGFPQLTLKKLWEPC